MQYALLEGEEVIGMMEMDEGRREVVSGALASQGIVVREAQVDDDGAVDIFEDCTPENERPCELTVALGMAQELAREAGVSSAEVDVLEAKGTATEQEAKAAVCAVVARLPEDWQPQGQTLVEAAWGECGCDCHG